MATSLEEYYKKLKNPKAPQIKLKTRTVAPSISYKEKFANFQKNASAAYKDMGRNRYIRSYKYYQTMSDLEDLGLDVNDFSPNYAKVSNLMENEKAARKDIGDKEFEKTFSRYYNLAKDDIKKVAAAKKLKKEKWDADLYEASPELANKYVYDENDPEDVIRQKLKKMPKSFGDSSAKSIIKMANDLKKKKLDEQAANAGDQALKQVKVEGFDNQPRNYWEDVDISKVPTKQELLDAINFLNKESGVKTQKDIEAEAQNAVNVMRKIQGNALAAQDKANALKDKAMKQQAADDAYEADRVNRRAALNKQIQDLTGDDINSTINRLAFITRQAESVGNDPEANMPPDLLEAKRLIEAADPMLFMGTAEEKIQSAKNTALTGGALGGLTLGLNTLLSPGGEIDPGEMKRLALGTGADLGNAVNMQNGKMRLMSGAEQEAMAMQYAPGAYIAGQIAGSLPSTLATGGAAAGVARGLGAGVKGARIIGAAVPGAIQSFSQSAAQGDSPLVVGAKTIAGGAINGLLGQGLVTPALESAVLKAASKAPGWVQQGLAKTAGALGYSATDLAGRLGTSAITGKMDWNSFLANLPSDIALNILLSGKARIEPKTKLSDIPPETFDFMAEDTAQRQLTGAPDRVQIPETAQSLRQPDFYMPEKTPPTPERLALPERASQPVDVYAPEGYPNPQDLNRPALPERASYPPIPMGSGETPPPQMPRDRLALPEQTTRFYADESGNIVNADDYYNVERAGREQAENESALEAAINKNTKGNPNRTIMTPGGEMAYTEFINAAKASGFDEARAADAFNIMYDRQHKTGGVDPLTQHEIDNFKVGGNFSNDSADAWDKFIKFAKGTKNSKRFFFGKVSTKLGGFIKHYTGLDVEGMNIAIKSDEIRHTKPHGKDAVPLTDDALKRLPEIFESPDYADLSTKPDSAGRTAFRLYKNINGWLVAVNGEAKGRGAIYIDSVYIRKRPPATSDAKAPNRTSETSSGPTSNHIVTQEAKNSKTRPGTDIEGVKQSLAYASAKGETTHVYGIGKSTRGKKEIPHVKTPDVDVTAGKGQVTPKPQREKLKAKDTTGRVLDDNTATRLKNSKLRDANGDHIVMYHGSVEDFEKFDYNKIRAVDDDAFYNGFWFSDQKDTSPAYRNAKHVKAYYLNAENPAPVDVVKKTIKDVRGSLSKGAEDWNELSRSVQDEVRHRLRKMGYDSIIHNDKPEINTAELEKYGRTDFVSARGNKYTLQKDTEWGGLSLLDRNGNEVAAGYEDVNDFLRMNERTVVMLDADKIIPVNPKTPEPDLTKGKGEKLGWQRQGRAEPGKPSNLPSAPITPDYASAKGERTALYGAGKKAIPQPKGDNIDYGAAKGQREAPRIVNTAPKAEAKAEAPPTAAKPQESTPKAPTKEQTQPEAAKAFPKPKTPPVSPSRRKPVRTETSKVALSTYEATSDKVLKKNLDMGLYDHVVESPSVKYDAEYESVKRVGVDEVIHEYSSATESKFGAQRDRRYDDRDTARITAALAQAYESGTVKQQQELLAIAVDMGTTQGRAVNMWKMLKKLNPDGYSIYLNRRLQKLNAQGRKLYKGKWKDLELTADEIDALKKGKTEAEWEAVEQKIGERIANEMPSKLTEKSAAWRRIAMLLNPVTHVRNLIGNGLMSGMIEARDMALGGLRKRLPEELQTIKYKTSKETRAIVDKYFDEAKVADQLGGSKYELGRMEAFNHQKRVFKNKALNWIDKKSLGALAWEDSLFKKGRYKKSLARYMDGKGLKEVTAEAHEYAIQDALEATFQDHSNVADFLNRMKKVRGLGAVTDVVVPFVKTPVNITKRALEYSPFGLGKGGWDLLDGGMIGREIKKIDLELSKEGITKEQINKLTRQRDQYRNDQIELFQKGIRNIAKGLTGTGVFGAGILMAGLGLVSGLEPDSTKESSFENDTGWQPLSLHVGDLYVPLEWAAPFAPVLLGGATFYHNLIAGNSNVAEAGLQGALALADTISNSSMLTSFRKTLNANGGIKKGGISPALISIGTDFVGQHIPTLGMKLNNITEPNQVSAYSKNPLEYIKNKAIMDIPGLRQGLEAAGLGDTLGLPKPMTNSWGKEKSSGVIWERLLDNLVSPANASIEEKNPVNAEIKRIYNEHKDTKVFPMTFPTKEVHYTDDRGKVHSATLNDRQAAELKQKIGQAYYDTLTRYINSTEYKSRSDKTRIKDFNTIYDALLQAYKQEFIRKSEIPKVRMK